MSPLEQAKLDVFIQENLALGHIWPSKSPMASPVFFIKKKEGSLRLVQDYRRLNAMTIKNRYPLPLIPELINHLRGAKYFTKLDVRWGYNNVWIKDGDEWKAVFQTNRGLFKPLVMFFGLTNSPATFEMMRMTFFRTSSWKESSAFTLTTSSSTRRTEPSTEESRDECWNGSENINST